MWRKLTPRTQLFNETYNTHCLTSVQTYLICQSKHTEFLFPVVAGTSTVTININV